MQDIGGLFWLFMMLSFLQPVLKQRMLESARVRLLRRIEQDRGSRVIALIHRQESMAFLGFPLFRYINMEDSEEVLRAIRMTGDDTPIDIIVHTPGGLVLAAEQIAWALRKHPARVTVFVPHYAMSGGTLLALAADEIVMDPHAVLGPVDPQIGQRPAASIVRVAESKPVGDVDDQTLIEADVARMALAQVKDTVRRLLAGRMADDQVERLADRLSQGYYTHDHSFSADDARQMGLPVSTDFPEIVHHLMALHPQPTRAHPAVQYLPVPRGARKAS